MLSAPPLPMRGDRGSARGSIGLSRGSVDDQPKETVAPEHAASRCCDECWRFDHSERTKAGARSGAGPTRTAADRSIPGRARTASRATLYAGSPTLRTHLFLRFVLVALAGWINQQQRDVIDVRVFSSPIARNYLPRDAQA
jgi:hypothetical protein